MSSSAACYSDFSIEANSFGDIGDLITFDLLDAPGNLDPGPGFIVDYSALSASGVQPNVFNVLQIGFSVTVLDPTKMLHDLSMTPALTRGCTVGQNLLCDLTDSLHGITPFGEGVTSQLDHNGATLELLAAVHDPVSAADYLMVHFQDCEVDGGPPGTCGFTTGTVEYRFSQVQVPEPATLGLFAVGLLGLGMARRRRG